MPRLLYMPIHIHIGCISLEWSSLSLYYLMLSTTFIHYFVVSRFGYIAAPSMRVSMWIGLGFWFGLGLTNGGELVASQELALPLSLAHLCGMSCIWLPFPKPITCRCHEITYPPCNVVPFSI